MSRQTEPYDEGYNAWQADMQLNDNPYPSLYAEHEEWDTGWNDACDENSQFGVGG